jgi:hypothetical protein
MVNKQEELNDKARDEAKNIFVRKEVGLPRDFHQDDASYHSLRHVAHPDDSGDDEMFDDIDEDEERLNKTLSILICSV